MILACLFWSCQQAKKSVLFLMISPLLEGSMRGESAVVPCERLKKREPEWEIKGKGSEAGERKE